MPHRARLVLLTTVPPTDAPAPDDVSLWECQDCGALTSEASRKRHVGWHVSQDGGIGDAMVGSGM